MLYGYDYTGRVTGLWADVDAVAYSFGYDTAGRAISQTQPSGSVVSWTVDANGNRISLTWPETGALAYSTSYAFSNPEGIEVKYFSTSLGGAQSYASQAASAFGDGPFTIIQTSIPASSITPDMSATVDRGIQTVVVPTGLLPSLSEPVILPPWLNP